MRRCWNCGAEQRWQCVGCGSFEQRPNGKGCAECHRRREAERYAARDFEVTPAMRRYLRAFDAYLRDPSAEDARVAAFWDLRHERGTE